MRSTQCCAPSSPFAKSEISSNTWSENPPTFNTASSPSEGENFLKEGRYNYQKRPDGMLVVSGKTEFTRRPTVPGLVETASPPA